MENQTSENVCNEGAFQKLFEMHARDLHNFLHYKYGYGANAEDLVQDAFIKLWNNCAKVPPEKARSFLFTVANNQMLNELGRDKIRAKFAQEIPEDKTMESPHYLLEENEYKQKLEQAIADLSEEQRVAFLLNRIEGKKHKEIADILGISQKAVEKRIYSALSNLLEKVGKI